MFRLPPGRSGDACLLLYAPIVFNLGEYRRQATEAYKNHDFFRPDNAQAMALRERVALEALEDVCEWIESGGGEVAVNTR